MSLAFLRVARYPSSTLGTHTSKARNVLWGASATCGKRCISAGTTQDPMTGELTALPDINVRHTFSAAL